MSTDHYVKAKIADSWSNKQHNLILAKQGSSLCYRRISYTSPYDPDTPETTGKLIFKEQTFTNTEFSED